MEIDATRFEKMVSLCSIDVSADLTYDTVIDAIDEGIKTLDDADVPKQSRVMFVSNLVYKLLKQSGEFFNIRVATTSNSILDRDVTTFDSMPLIAVPQTRFYSDIDLSATNGYAKAAGAKDLNFVIADSSSVSAITNYIAPKIVTPEYNNDADAFIFGYRVFHDLIIPKNKLNGVYIHTVA